ncbi:hypothetical protein [Mycolicibacterium sarraceniae]|uniref:Uncharacterized protein n=1 Tax=Mycolicibacterium sarraceniae TaxID=1534348 RepID=A0A7I7SMC6_9MYCO|nr:hypothetical protein MSAR_03010 [Mycolicibacterium sarraceniae]
MNRLNAIGGVAAFGGTLAADELAIADHDALNVADVVAEIKELTTPSHKDRRDRSQPGS